MLESVYIVAGDCIIKNEDDIHYYWYNQDGTSYKLTFSKAYHIESKELGVGIRNCTYKIGSKIFKDINFLHGNICENIFTKKDFGDCCSYDVINLRGVGKAVHHYHNVPVFDAEDREFDGDYHVLLYRDEYGVNLLQTRGGYKLSRIYIYVKLEQSTPNFNDWLRFCSYV